jgi:ribosomal protein S3AE
MQRGTEFQKLATMFYSYFNHMYNRQRDLVRSARDAKHDRRLRHGGWRDRSWLMLVAPAIIGNVVSGQGPQDDEERRGLGARKVGVNMFLGVPLVRDAANLLERKALGSLRQLSGDAGRARRRRAR